MLTCSICGNEEFKDQEVLWSDLVSEWQLSPHEVAYINRQQGTQCTRCHANLRGVALGRAILSAVGGESTLEQFAETAAASELHVLDLNGTSASQALSRLPRYIRADYPEVDMQRMPYPDESFDLIIHSDTLEHVPHPVAALVECRRILKVGGSLCYTVPTIVGRLTRGRGGLSPSYHGNPQETGYDFIVHTEFGADAWTYPIQAGFSDVRIHAVEFPAATALSAIS